MNNMGKKVACFIHSTTMELNKDRFLIEILEHLRTSSLLSTLSFLCINNTGLVLDETEIERKYAPAKVIHCLDKTNEFENPTIKLLYAFSKLNPEYKVLYLHTKGITCQDNENVMDWIDMMKYFVIDQHDNCSKLLKSHDSVGCNYSAQPYKHFSGNFWWANSNYIKQKLTKIYSDKKHINEWWICSGNDVNNFNLHNSGINHYNTRYTADKYNDSLYRIM